MDFKVGLLVKGLYLYVYHPNRDSQSPVGTTPRDSTIMTTVRFGARVR